MQSRTSFTEAVPLTGQVGDRLVASGSPTVAAYLRAAHTWWAALARTTGETSRTEHEAAERALLTAWTQAFATDRQRAERARAAAFAHPLAPSSEAPAPPR